MQYHILRIAKQTGSFTLDEKACYQEMMSECDELFSEDTEIPQPMFRCVDGKLQIFDGGYDSDNEWCNHVNLWGFVETYFLKILAKHLKGNGTIILSMDNEGNPPEAFEIKNGKVKKLF